MSTTYNIYQRENLDQQPVQIATGLTSKNYAVSGLIKGKKYLFSVGAVKSGLEKISDEISFEQDPYWDSVVCLLSLDGNLIDKKGNIWTPSGTPVYAPARFNEGFSMNGSTMRTASLPYSALTNLSNTSITFDFWYTHARSSTWSAVLAQRNSSSSSVFSVGLAGNSNRLYWEVAGVGTVGLNMSVGETALISFELDKESGKLRSYKNGVLIEDLSITGNFSTAALPLRIGSLNQTNNPGVGIIDELRITKVARYKGVNFTVRDTPFPDM